MPKINGLEVAKKILLLNPLALVVGPVVVVGPVADVPAGAALVACVGEGTAVVAVVDTVSVFVGESAALYEDSPA
jgi:hypothetical protein